MTVRTTATSEVAPPTRDAWALGVVELVCWGVLVYAFSVFLPAMHRDLGWSQVLLTSAYSLSVLVRAFAVVAAGWWIDRHGATALMVAGTLGGAAVLLAWSTISSVAALFIVFVGLGLVSSAVLYEPAFAIVVRRHGPRRDSALLIVTVVGGFASTVFLPLTAALTTHLGWRHALLVLGAIMVLGATVPLAALVRDRPADRATGRADEVGLSAAARRALGSAPFRWLTLAAFLVYLTLVFVNVHLVSYLLEQGYSATTAATAAGALGILSVLGRITLTRIGRRIRLARVTAVLVTCQAVAVVALLTGTVAGLVAFILLFGAGFGVLTLARASLLADYAPRQMYARWSGLHACVVTVAQVLAPIGGSLLRDRGGYPVMFAVGGLLSALASASLLMADRAAHRRA